VSAKVERHQDGIFVSIEDSYGRASERIVADVATASAIVESWARGDLTDPLMMSLLPVSQESDALNETGPPAPEAPIAPVALVFQPWALLLGLDGEASVGFDGSTWFGGNLSGCGRLGPVCIGAMARVAFDSMLTGDSKSMATNRTGVDLLVIADFPMKWGIITFIPGIGVGAGWVRASRYVDTPIAKKADEEDDDEEDDDDDTDDNNDDDDDTNDETEYARTKKDMDRIDMRLNAHMFLGFQLSQRFVLVIGISADVLLFAHTAPYVVEQTEIAGEPRGFVRGVLGLRFGAP
jgi:hypothetical protein